MTKKSRKAMRRSQKAAAAAVASQAPATTRRLLAASRWMVAGAIAAISHPSFAASEAAEKKEAVRTHAVAVIERSSYLEDPNYLWDPATLWGRAGAEPGPVLIASVEGVE